MSEIVLQVNNLSKKYKKVDAVKGVSFDIQKGNVYGLLGPNGSGKTTTLAMLMGILHPTQGSFSWFGNGQEDRNRLRIGCLLETPNFYPYLNAYDNLRVTATIKNMPDPKARIEEVLEYVDLKERGKRTFRTYSLGMKQRLAVASALLSDPEVLVLDEPTNDLDIQTLNILEDFLMEFGGCLLLVSHDRYFMDKLVEHLFVFEGEGKIKDFPGNYTDFREWEKETEDRGPKTEEPKADKQAPKVEKSEAAPKAKASFKQKQEFKKVNETIAKLEGEKSTITDQIAAGTSDVNQLMTWTNRLQSIDRELEELELTWLDLSELDGIE